MLCEIRCSSFNSFYRGKIQSRIVFHPGLNIVCGGAAAENSIGKTTFLNIIDFVFGSEHYPTEDVLKNVGHHSVEFRFEFEGESFYFSRSTQRADIVSQCNSEYVSIATKNLDEFRKFLSMKYGLDKTGLSFRDALRCYLRIYSRKENLPNDPIKTVGDNKGKSLERLLKLYGKFDEIADSLNRKKEAEAKKMAYKSAQNFKIINKITKGKKKKNEERIAYLKRELEKYESEFQLEYRDFPADLYELSLEIRTELAKLKRRRSRIKANISLVCQNQDIVSAKLGDKLADLREFFPEASLRKIEEFHKGLKNILAPNIKEAREQLLQELNKIDEKIEEIHQDLKKSSQRSGISDAVFHRCAGIQKEMDEITLENKMYDDSLAAENGCKIAKNLYAEVFKGAAGPIESAINGKLHAFNEILCGKDVSVPRFTVKGMNSYKFVNANDEGTGANDRGIQLFHLTVLQTTALPILIEDSVNFKNIADEHFLKLLELFSESPKQIFIALDKAKHYSKDLIVPKIIQDNIVLKLAKGQELFGRAWNLKLDKN